MSKDVFAVAGSSAARKYYLAAVLALVMVALFAASFHGENSVLAAGPWWTNGKGYSVRPTEGQAAQKMPSEVASCGPDHVNLANSRLQWQGMVQKYEHLRDDKFTIALQTYKRLDILLDTLDHLGGTHVPSLHEIVIVWNEIDATPPADYVAPNGVPVRYRVSEQNSMNMKFVPDPKYETQAILLHDDDVYFQPGDLEFAFQTWRQFGKTRLTGGLGRCYETDEQGKLKYAFCPQGSDSYAFVLSNLAFLHISFLDFYHSNNEFAVANRGYVDKVFNCDDLAINILVSMLTCQGPLQVRGHDDYIRKKPQGISTGTDHMQIRHECLNWYTDLVGYNAIIQTDGFMKRGVSPIH